MLLLKGTIILSAHAIFLSIQFKKQYNVKKKTHINKMGILQSFERKLFAVDQEMFYGGERGIHCFSEQYDRKQV